MHFAVLPPEVNSGRMYAGPGAGSMLAAAAAWDELADELHTTAADVESVISGLTSEPWEGTASESMAAAAVPQVTWLSSTAAQATQASAQAKAAASAYESAYAMTVPPPEISANRAQLTSLIATNLLGQNTPAIAANEVAYGEMWAPRCTATRATRKRPRRSLRSPRQSRPPTRAGSARRAPQPPRLTVRRPEMPKRH